MKYVWVWWDFDGSRPSVEKYVLVKSLPRGGVTVMKYGRKDNVRPMTGKRFFFSEAELKAHHKRWLENQIKRCRSRLEDLEADAARADLGMDVSAVRDTQIETPKLKLYPNQED